MSTLAIYSIGSLFSRLFCIVKFFSLMFSRNKIAILFPIPGHTDFKLVEAGPRTGHQWAKCGPAGPRLGQNSQFLTQ